MSTSSRPLTDNDLDFGPTLRGLRMGMKVFAQRYTLVRQLGRGGMGVVWLAQDSRLDREVALKFLPESVQGDPVAVDELKRETKRCLELTHSNIVRIFDFEQEDSSAAIAMEYVEGQTLNEVRLQRPSRVFEADEILPWLQTVITALHYAHTEAKMVHRDLKPANFMLDHAGRLKLADFGIACRIGDSFSRLSRGTHAAGAGTLVYMSPQQMMGFPPSVADDIYSLGATLYELFTGKPPFHSGSIERQIEAVSPPSMTARRAELEVASATVIPSSWEQAVAACLEKEIPKRPATIHEVWQQLQGDGKDFSTNAIAPVRTNPPESPRVTKISSPGFFGTRRLAAIALILITGGFGLWWITGGLLPSYDTLWDMKSAALTERAEAGDARAQGILAVRHRYGWKVQSEKAQEVRWAQTSAAANDPFGLYSISQLQFFGGLGKTDKELANRTAAPAIPKLQELSMQGQQIATACLADMLADGIGAPQDVKLSLKLLQDSSANGNALVTDFLGDAYGGRKGFTKDLLKASEFYQKSADQGLTRSQAELGYLYCSGQGVTKDVPKGLALLQKAAEQNSALANYYLAGLQFSAGLPKNPTKAAEFYQKAADLGHIGAQAELGYLYCSGQGVTKDVPKGLALLQKAAEQDSARANYYLAGFQFSGAEGLPKNPTKAAEFYQKAADLGSIGAQAVLGYLYCSGQGVTKDVPKGLALLQKAAEQDSALANYYLAGLQFSGAEGLPKNPTKGAEFYQKAADLGFLDAQAELGNFYCSGQGVTKDVPKGLALLQKAAEQGNALAQVLLANLYSGAEGISKDLPKAAGLYLQASSQGNLDAQMNLGVMYYRGEGVAKNTQKAVELFQKASDLNHGHALNWLGYMYENGDGVVKDLRKAQSLYEKAAAQGIEQAKESVKRLESGTTR